VPVIDEPTEAFLEFTQNLEYAKRLVNGGERLAQLRVGAFDVDDLYRAAWVQAVAALDHWVTREIVDRAVRLAEQPKAARPPKFNKLTIPVELFEQVHHHNQPLSTTFRAYLETTFGYMSFQNPDKIKDGFAHVSTVNLWSKVAEVLNQDRPHSDRITADLVRTRFREIAGRRNKIAHTADRDPASPSKRAAITAAEALSTIEWLLQSAQAILLALGKLPPAPDYDAVPEDVGIEETPTDSTGRRPAPAGRSAWDEDSLREHIEKSCPSDVATVLLAVYRHAEIHPSFRGYYFGEGVHPSVTAWFDFGEDEAAAVWSIYTGANKSVLSINFQWMRDRSGMTKRLAKLAKTLSALPGLQDLPAELSASDYRKRPSLGQKALSAHAAKKLITRALNDLLFM
jgi:hypothetical protein